jgi:hypothetical protein
MIIMSPRRAIMRSFGCQLGLISPNAGEVMAKDHHRSKLVNSLPISGMNGHETASLWPNNPCKAFLRSYTAVLTPSPAGDTCALVFLFPKRLIDVQRR